MSLFNGKAYTSHSVSRKPLTLLLAVCAAGIYFTITEPAVNAKQRSGYSPVTITPSQREESKCSALLKSNGADISGLYEAEIQTVSSCKRYMDESQLKLFNASIEQMQELQLAENNEERATCVENVHRGFEAGKLLLNKASSNRAFQYGYNVHEESRIYADEGLTLLERVEDAKRLACGVQPA